MAWRAWKAECLDGRSARPLPARLAPAAGGGLRLAWGGRRERLGWKGVKVRVLAGGWAELALPDGRLLRLRDPAGLDWLRAQGRLKRPWLRRSGVQAGIVALAGAWMLALLAVFGLGWGLNPLLDRVLRHAPPDFEQKLDQDLRAGLQVHAEHSPELARALRRLERLLEPEAGPVRILVMDDGLVNAFALPGGTLVLHRGLLSRLEEESELFALLGHEAEHVRGRHALRRLARAAALGVLSAAVIGDAGGLSAVLLQQGKDLSLLRHSRQEELDADAAGLALVARLGLDPQGAVRLMRRLEQVGEGGGRLPELLSTHPHSAGRVARLEALAADLSLAPPRKKRLLSPEDWQVLTRPPTQGR